MKLLGENIRKLRKSRGLTQVQVADIVGASSYTTISKWESGDNSPHGKDLVILSDLFNTSVDGLLGLEGDLTLKHSYTFIPTAISAGLPITVDGITETEKISIPDSIMGKWAGHKDIYITKVNGESMNLVIADQSLIAVKPVTLNDLSDNDIVVFSNDHEYGVKRYFKSDDEIIFRPDSSDIRFPETRINVNEVDNLQIHGKVVLYIVEMD